MVTAIDQTQPALLDVRQVADTLGCSPRHIYRLADSGQMPAPVKLGALVRWRKSEVDEWVAAGCPPVRRPRTSSRPSNDAA